MAEATGIIALGGAVANILGNAGTPDDIKSENLVAQNAALGGAVAAAVLPSGSFSGALLAATTGSAAYVTAEGVANLDWSTLKADWADNAPDKTIANDVRSITADFIAVAGNELQVAGALASQLPVTKPFSLVAEGIGNDLALAGIAISAPDYFNDVTKAGYNALVDKSKSLITSATQLLKNYGSEFTTSANAAIGSVETSLQNFLNQSLKYLDDLSQSTTSDATLQNDDTLTLDDATTLQSSDSNFFSSEGLSPENVTETAQSIGAVSVTNPNNTLSISSVTGSSQNGNFGASISDTIDGDVVDAILNFSPEAAETSSTTAAFGASSASETTQTTSSGSIEQQTTFNQISINTPSSNPVEITTDASGLLIAEVSSSTPADEITFETASGGSDQVLIGDPTGTTYQQVIDYAPGGLTGDTIDISNSGGSVEITTDVGAADSAIIASDDNVSGVVQDVEFDDPQATLVLDSPTSFLGTISNFLVGDTLDLAGVSATSATITAADVLLITEAGGATFSLKLDPSENYSDLTLYVQDESSGGSNIIAQSAPAVSGSQSITVYSTIETALGTMATYDATVSVTPTTVDFGAERADGTLPEIVPITVTYTAGKPDPTLPDDITVSDGYATINGLGPDKKSGTLSIENPGFIDGNNTQALPFIISYESGSATLDLETDFKIYTPAVPEYIINGNTGGSNIAYYDFGALHVGDTGSLDIGITNVATGALVDSLISSPGTLGEFTAENGVDLASGQTGTIAVTFTADVSGLVTDDQSTLLNLVSHDSALPDEATAENPSFSAEVYNYAEPELVEGTIGTLDANGNETINYPAVETGGTLTQTGADIYTLDFGRVFKSSAASDDANILIDNALPSEATGALDDGLSGSFSVSGSGINHALSSVIAAGTGGIFQVLGQFSPSLTNLGTNTLTVIYHPTSVDSAGTTDLPDITLTVTDDLVACFLAGTRISTARGEITVEQLAIGDQAVTQAGVARRVTWLGHRRIDCGKHPKPADVWPVRIAAGAFGPQQPQRDLWLSPDHAVFAEGVLIPVKYLINGATIVQEPRNVVTYWHVELERHDVILAEGLPCESYLDTGNRDAFANGGSATQLHPDFVREGGEAIWEATACAPLRIEGERVARVIARLRRRANKEAGHREASGSRRRRLPHRAAKCDLGRLLQPDWYLAENPDVAAVGMDAVQHYAGWGRAEGRLPCPEVELIRGLGLIDPGLVIFSMADVVAAGVDPIEHFCEGGWRERRRPNPYFDTGWYLDTHDVPAGMNPLLHYVLTGESVPPGRHFDPVWYRRRYALPCKVSPLAHYLAHRRTQRVSPLPSFNVAAYVRAHDDTLRPDRDAYAHYLAIGQFTTADTGQVDRAAA